MEGEEVHCRMNPAFIAWQSCCTDQLCQLLATPSMFVCVRMKVTKLVYSNLLTKSHMDIYKDEKFLDIIF